MMFSRLTDAGELRSSAMQTKIFLVLLSALGLTHIVQSKRTIFGIRNFSCNRDVVGKALNLTAMMGIWYEAARIPNMDIMKCLNVSVPATADRKLKLKLEYISTVNGEIHAVRETIAFPWNDHTKNSVFDLEYKIKGNKSVPVTYKVVYSDANLLTVLCGYSTLSPMPLFKLLTRRRQLDQQWIDYIQSEADKAGIGSHIIWPEQSPGQCNAAVRPATGALMTLLALTVLWRHIKCIHK